MTDRVGIVGAGRAGRGLARALRASGIPVVGLRARRAPVPDPDGATVGELAEVLTGATVVCLAVQDAALPACVAELVSAGFVPPVVLQLSGSAADAVLDPLRASRASAGTFHPLVPLSDAAQAPSLFRGAWVGVAGDPLAVAAGERIAAALGARTLAIPLDPGARAIYHAAAVVASNFPVALAALAERLLVEAGVGRGEARPAGWHLMRSAVENLHGRDPATALTGPVVRGDVETVRRHVAALSDDPVALRAYAALTAVVLDTAGVAIAADVGATIARLVHEAAPDGAPVPGPAVGAQA